ncbi:hypothetical protein TGDOM2_398330, partial [Toxoplasma gondii GAB2-2007-GAL-DOM2]
LTGHEHAEGDVDGELPASDAEAESQYPSSTSESQRFFPESRKRRFLVWSLAPRLELRHEAPPSSRSVLLLLSRDGSWLSPSLRTASRPCSAVVPDTLLGRDRFRESSPPSLPVKASLRLDSSRLRLPRLPSLPALAPRAILKRLELPAGSTEKDRGDDPRRRGFRLEAYGRRDGRGGESTGECLLPEASLDAPENAFLRRGEEALSRLPGREADREESFLSESDGEGQSCVLRGLAYAASASKACLRDTDSQPEDASADAPSRRSRGASAR